MVLKNLLPNNQKKLYGYDYEFLELVKLYKNKKLPSKIFFTGPKGIGKATMAYHLINYIFSSLGVLKTFQKPKFLKICVMSGAECVFCSKYQFFVRNQSFWGRLEN